MLRDTAQFECPMDASILDALRCIDRGAGGIAVLVDANRRFQGLVTDGDVRRGLIAGAKLQDPVRPLAGKNPYVVGPEMSRQEVIEIMRVRSFLSVPVLGPDQRLVGIHFLKEFVMPELRPDWAVILAGGFGTRLGKLTKETPKPMLLVAGQPILERIVHQIVGSGIRTIFIAVHYLKEQIIDYFGDGSEFGCEIHYLYEEEPLGTAGCLSLLPPVEGKNVLLMNGDIVTDMNPAALIDHHNSKGNIATVASREYSVQVPFGCLEQSEAGMIARIVEKPVISHEINAGIYCLSPGVIKRISPTFTLITDVITALLDADEQVGSFSLDSAWIDVGRPEDLNQARNG